MEELDIEKDNKIVGDIIAVVLLVLIFASLIFVYAKFFGPDNIKIPAVTQTSVIVDADFINSQNFKSLKYVPDPSIFDDVSGGTFSSGKEDPFSSY